MQIELEQRMVAAINDCPARLVPSGEPITIPANTFVTITQARGGNYTVRYQGNLARVDGTDALALGLEPETIEYPAAQDGEVQEDWVWDTLRTVYDPEIPVSIVDLGLIYGVELTPQDSGTHITIKMTLTAPGCGMGQVLADDVEYRVKKIPNVERVTVTLVFDPPWSRDMISEEAQLELGIF